MRRATGLIVAILAGIWVFLPVPAGHAHPSHITAVASAEETSVLPSWLRYSASCGLDLSGSRIEEEKVNRELSRLADRLRPEVAAAKGGREIIAAFRRVLLKEEGFTYDRSAGNTEYFLIERVLAGKRGNCLGMSLLWLSLAEKLGVPFRGVHVPGHCFVRYEGEGKRINVEFADGGAPWSDNKYREEFRLGREGPYLRSLSSAEMLGVFLTNVGAAYTKKGKHAEALAVFAEGAHNYSGSPEVHYNAAIALQRLGRVEEAIAKYREALFLDPNLSRARGNLGILLSRQGRHDEGMEEAKRAVEMAPWNATAWASMGSTCCVGGDYDSGIRSYQRALEIDPSNVQARAGLARALFAKRNYRAAARECERAQALGWRFEPTMLEVLGLNRERDPLP